MQKKMIVGCTELYVMTTKPWLLTFYSNKEEVVLDQR